ncbi:MAG: ABC transporter permease [Clostridiales bacterium]|nr:ABC transporter permease [Clostridiales bacterium]
MDKNKFVFVDKQEIEEEEYRKSLTYWQDAWRRLKKHKLAMIGLIGVVLIVLIGIFGPMLTQFSYSDQVNDYKNLPPKLDLYKVDDDIYIYLSGDYFLFSVAENGRLIKRLELPKENKDIINKVYTYVLDGEPVILDFSYNLLPGKRGYDYDFTLEYKGNITHDVYKTVLNKIYPFGTDSLGRDMLTRTMYGARISLIVAFVATLVNFIIGVTYGAIAGYEGGRKDNIMMRFVDIVNSIPLVLYVILLMVLLRNQGLWTIILALGSVYWVGMARLVRGQILALKEQEFVLAARTLGVSKKKIIMRHLIPNAMGPIIVAMTMMIPSAVFTESFLSFIGLGVSAPMASWGTLANNALSGLITYPYQLFYPALAIAITMLAFNFLGDGLRDALDPRLRKG